MNQTDGACNLHPNGCPDGSHQSSNLVSRLRLLAANLWSSESEATVREAIAAIEQFWRPIETAPLEGAHLLVADEGEVVSEARHIESHGWYLAQNDPTDSWGPGPLNPTHWMPLPCAPGTRPPPRSSVETTSHIGAGIPPDGAPSMPMEALRVAAKDFHDSYCPSCNPGDMTCRLGIALLGAVETTTEPAGIPTPPSLWNAVSHLLSHWDEHRRCFELCGTAMQELREAFAAAAAPGRGEPPSAEKASEQRGESREEFERDRGFVPRDASGKPK